jgi:hypothetical protein
VAAFGHLPAPLSSGHRLQGTNNSWRIRLSTDAAVLG